MFRLETLWIELTKRGACQKFVLYLHRICRGTFFASCRSCETVPRRIFASKNLEVQSPDRVLERVYTLFFSLTSYEKEDKSCLTNCTYIKHVDQHESVDDATAGMIIVLLLFILPSQLTFWPFAKGNIF